MSRKIVYGLIGILLGAMGMFGVILLIESHYGPAFTILGAVVILFSLLFMLTATSIDEELGLKAETVNPFAGMTSVPGQIMTPDEEMYGNFLYFSDNEIVIAQNLLERIRLGLSEITKVTWNSPTEKEPSGWAIVEAGTQRFAIYPQSRLKAVVLYEFLVSLGIVPDIHDEEKGVMDESNHD